MIMRKEDYSPYGWLLSIFIVLNFFLITKLFHIKNKTEFNYISIIAYLLVFLNWFLLYLIFGYIRDNQLLYKESLVLGVIFFLISVILEWKHIPYWLDGEKQDDFKKNALTQLDILKNAYKKHNAALVLEHLQYLQTVVEEERFEELHKIENLESVWKMKSKLEMIFKEIEKETAKLQWKTYRKEIKKPLNLLKDYLDLLR